MTEPMQPSEVPDELCDQLTARIETAMAMGKDAREIAHSIMPIVLAGREAGGQTQPAPAITVNITPDSPAVARAIREVRRRGGA